MVWFWERIETLNIKSYINNVNEYHKKVIDKNNTTQDTIEKIFKDVEGVDVTYSGILCNINTSLEQWNKYIVSMSEIVSPSKNCFNSSDMSRKLDGLIKDISNQSIQC